MLRPDDPHLQIALDQELSRAGRQAELQQILPKAIATVQKALQTTPTDGDLQRLLANLLLEQLPLLAAAYIATEQWELAKADWLRAIESKPDLAQTAYDRFTWAQRWSEATIFGSVLMKQKPADSYLWVRVPPIFVLSQNDAAYRSFCQGVVENYRKAPTGIAADRVVKGCLLRPGAIDLTELPGDLLAQSLNDGTVPAGFRSWGWGTLALLAYRNGDAESALKHITQSEQTKPIDPAHALNLAVLALAQHQLQHPDEARKALDEASQVIQRLQAIDKNHHDLLIAEILSQGAEASMKEKEQPKESDSEEKQLALCY